MNPLIIKLKNAIDVEMKMLAEGGIDINDLTPTDIVLDEITKKLSQIILNDYEFYVDIALGHEKHLFSIFLRKAIKDNDSLCVPGALLKEINSFLGLEDAELVLTNQEPNSANHDLAVITYEIMSPTQKDNPK